MLNKLHLRTKILASVTGVILILGGLYFILLLKARENAVYKEADAKLLSAARSLKFILPPGYHDRITNEASVSAAQFDQIVDANNRFCREEGLQYLWSVLVLGPRDIVFTSSTSPDLEVSRHQHARFFERHSDPEAFTNALQSRKPCFSTFKNQWGTGRMVLIPEVDRLGRVHIFGCSIALDKLAGIQGETLKDTLFLLLLASAVVSLLVSRFIRTALSPIESLTRAAETMARGDFDKVIARVEGSTEAVLLSQSLESMRKKICRQMTELIDSEQHFRFLVSATPAIIYTLRASDLHALFISENVAAIQGHSPREFLENPDFWIDHVHPDDRAAVMATTAQLTPGSSLVREYRFRIAKGCYRWMQDAMKLVGDTEGNPAIIAGYWIDITQRKEATEALRINRERLEQAQKFALLGSWELDHASGRVECSAEVLEIIERDATAVGHSTDAFFTSVHPDDRHRVENVYKTAFSRGGAQELDHRLVMADGRVKWVRARWKTDLNADGSPAVSTGTVQDISDHMLARESRNLTIAKEAAEAANLAKSAFLASMSHEIRTPMNAVLGFAQVLLGDSELNARQRKQVESINRSGRHLLGLINDILDMAKIESGRMGVSVAGTPLRNLLHDLETMFRHSVEQKQIALIIEPAANLPRTVVTDPKKLMQILINLTDNAVKFTRIGGVTVRMAAESDLNGEWHLRVEVEDTGLGIPEADLPRLFERFEQPRSSQESKGGSGLGLAISRGLARLMGGDITVRSQLGSGSVFTMVLPVTLAKSPAPEVEIARLQVSGLPPNFTRRRILVVDDIDVNCEILVRMLSRVGFELQTATSGSRGLELAASWGPDLILMDLRMPGLSGLDAIRMIRAQEKGGRIPIMAITASVLDEQCAQATQAGADDFIRKPFLESELFQKVGSLLGVKYILEAESPVA